MRICDSFLHDGKCYVACSGPGIAKEMAIHRIEVGGNEYNVNRVDITQSFSGHYQAMLEVDSHNALPQGDFIVLS